ncbi:hypothetical protein DXG03_003584 [Asterophora parasitica]|uniref:Uncharacterized protein n=1 Tax=Asterophora parasitica TaxID=117018 RepID=A0A9P7KAI3_9AGAR|nr:hypothetical protein DXG03_003584 [Asterophora parasitica]
MQVKKLNYLRFSAEFRDIKQYCNLMYTLLSTLPERLLPSKTPFTSYVQEHIFYPLGMNATTYSYPVANATGDVAEGLLHEENPSGNGTARAVPMLFSLRNSTVLTGALAMRSTWYTTWLKALLLNGANPETIEAVISADVVDKAARGVSIWQGKALGYGALELCVVSNPLPANASNNCLTLAADASRIFPGAITPGVPTLLAEYNSVTGSHALFSHFNGNLFNATLLSSFGMCPTHSGFRGLGKVGPEFADGGLGLTGAWGAGAGVPPLSGKTSKERAEAWFDRA